MNTRKFESHMSSLRFWSILCVTCFCHLTITIFRVTLVSCIHTCIFHYSCTSNGRLIDVRYSKGLDSPPAVVTILEGGRDVILEKLNFVYIKNADYNDGKITMRTASRIYLCVKKSQNENSIPMYWQRR